MLPKDRMTRRRMPAPAAAALAALLLSGQLLGEAEYVAPPAAATAKTSRPKPGLQKLKVSENRRFLVKADGTPFFWLGDTAWELFHRLNREEAIEYLNLRAKQKYTVIQAVAVAELEGVDEPNPYGDLPFVNRDPAKQAVTPGSNPNNAEEYDYWDHVEFIVDEANRRGMYVAFLPAWGSLVNGVRDISKRLIHVGNAQAFGQFMGRRFSKKGIIWILGGDLRADGFEDVFRDMAKGIAIGATGKEDYGSLLMSFHPLGGRTSSEWFHNEPWLSFNMWQTGHRLTENTKTWEKITPDYQRVPTKPVLDGEPLYEDMPLGFKYDNGYGTDALVRQRAYWAVFAGAFGHTYGNNSVWQMWSPGKRPLYGAVLYPWWDAMHRPGAQQMQHLRTLIESRPILSRVPDQSIVAGEFAPADYTSATRGEGYLFVYSPQGKSFSLNLGKISGEQLTGWWYNPRNGDSIPLGNFIENDRDKRQVNPRQNGVPVSTIRNDGVMEFVPPAEGLGADWVLVLDDQSKGYPDPATATAGRRTKASGAK